MPYFLDEYRDGLSASVVLKKKNTERYFFIKKVWDMLFVFHLDAEVNAAEVVLRESLEERKGKKSLKHDFHLVLLKFTRQNFGRDLG